ncbi:hypothetical protein GALMADRAFT_223221 [Galerina marginata CBS 339.88]|uniref:Uncharacterized protein n=1 Tax=Galerina marginata (strain CBS 339.88) TaxID=685588 RepID=A0A067TAU2_GALM3|nr:hypothetical protein GALMADRAFT_223221 [Galerina marginata CBS 339.88]
MPPGAISLLPHRWTVERIIGGAERLSRYPPDVPCYLSPRLQCRRWCRIWGAVELPNIFYCDSDIRIVNRKPPTWKDMLTGIGKAAEVPFISAHFRDLASVSAAFRQSGLGSDEDYSVLYRDSSELLRPSSIFLPRYIAINIHGTTTEFLPGNLKNIQQT